MLGLFKKKQETPEDIHIRKLRDVLRIAEQPHGTIDGRTHCQEGQSQIEYLRLHKHGCSRCIAREKLALVCKALHADALSDTERAT